MPLKINLEYRKGILFIRIKGNLNKDTYLQLLKKTNSYIIENEINNIVINMEEIKNIDLKGINTLLYLYEIITNNKGNIYLCNIQKIDKILNKNHIFKYIKKIDSELDSFKLIKI